MDILKVVRGILKQQRDTIISSLKMLSYFEILCRCCKLEKLSSPAENTEMATISIL
jgi:hypothetical protein